MSSWETFQFNIQSYDLTIILVWYKSIWSWPSIMQPFIRIIFENNVIKWIMCGFCVFPINQAKCKNVWQRRWQEVVLGLCPVCPGGNTRPFLQEIWCLGHRSGFPLHASWCPLHTGHQQSVFVFLKERWKHFEIKFTCLTVPGNKSPSYSTRTHCPTSMVASVLSGSSMLSGPSSPPSEKAWQVGWKHWQSLSQKQDTGLVFMTPGFVDVSCWVKFKIQNITFSLYSLNWTLKCLILSWWQFCGIILDNGVYRLLSKAKAWEIQLI